MERLPLSLVTLFCLLAGLRALHWIRYHKASATDVEDSHPLGRFNNPVWLVSSGLLFVLIVIYAVNHSSEHFDWMHRFRLPVPPELCWAGIVAAFGGLILLHCSHLALGKNFSANLRLRENHSLITGGPYNYVRHPMYSALLLFFAGAAVASANLLTGGMCFFIGVLLVLRITREEKLMEARFGEAYQRYTLEIGCLFPRLPFSARKTA